MTLKKFILVNRLPITIYVKAEKGTDTDVVLTTMSEAPDSAERYFTLQNGECLILKKSAGTLCLHNKISGDFLGEIQEDDENYVFILVEFEKGKN